jgi:hypothetical protein
MIYWKAGGHPSSVGMAVSFSVAETGSARSSSIGWNGSNIFSVKRLAAGSAIRVERGTDGRRSSTHFLGEPTLGPEESARAKCRGGWVRVGSGRTNPRPQDQPRQAAGVRNRYVLRLRRQDRDRLDLEQEGRVGEARDLHQRRGGKRLLVREVGAAHLAKLRAVRFDVG